MTSETWFPRYAKWMANDKVKEDLKKELKRAGIPLQSKARKVLERNGFRCSNYHYFQPSEQKEGEEYLPTILQEGKYRELDIYAFKTRAYSFKVLNSEITFGSIILMECKYLTDIDFFAFETKDNYLPAFPVIFNGEHLLGSPYLDFKFPMTIEKIAEVNVSKRQKGYGDKTTHQACEQLTAAFSYLYERKLQQRRIEYLNLYNRVFRRMWEKFLTETEVKRVKRGPIEEIPKEVISEFIRNNFSPQQILDNVHLYVELGFPIMLIDENMGLIKVIYDQNGSIKKFEDVGYGIYPFVSENANRYNNILGRSFAFPIIICNLQYLNRCLKALDDGLRKTVDYAETMIKNNPYVVGEEIMMSKTILRL